MMKPMVLGLGAVAAAVVGVSVWAMSGTVPAGDAAAAPAGTAGAQLSEVSAAAAMMAANPLDITSADRVEGSMMAPVTIVEYASLTCSHCAEFNNKTLPDVRKNWVANGKVKYVFRDMPWDNLALGMAKIARCVPAEQFKPMVNAFFEGQLSIMKASDPLVEIKKIAAKQGLSGEQVDACIKDPDIHAQVTGSKDTAFNKLGVRGTPTLFVNGEVVNGAVPYSDLKKTLDAAYAKATGKK